MKREDLPTAIVTGDRVGDWVAERVHGKRHSDSQAVGLLRYGELVAGVLFEDWNRASITAHIAIEGRITRTFLRVISRYAFCTLQVKKVIGVVAASNVKALEFDRRFGFVEEARIVDAHPCGELVIVSLTRDRCRYLD